MLPSLTFNYSTLSDRTGYGLDCRRIESRWGARFAAPVETGPAAHPLGVFPGGKATGAWR